MKSYWRLASAVLLGGTLAACGGSPPPAPASAASDQAARIAIFLSPGASGPYDRDARARLHGAIADRLVALGYDIVEERARANITIDMATSVTVKSSLFTVVVNGRRQVGYLVHATIAASGAGRMLGTESLEFDASSGASQDQVEAICHMITDRGVTAYLKHTGVPVESVASNESSARVAPATTSGASFVAAAPQPGAYAFIVGIDKYRDIAAATGARADAERFAEIARKTLGLKEDHVRVALEDHATRSDINEGLKWLRSSVGPGSRVYFFYSGHGAPSPDSSTYLLPYDGNPKDVAGTAVAMTDLMASLGQTNAKEVFAIVDACFSGAGGRSVLPEGARPLMRVKETVPTGQIALFTASGGDEISGPAPGEVGGVFTKYVTAGLGTGEADANGDGQVSLQELSDYVSPRVARESKRDNREQHPKLVVGSSVGDAGSFIVEYGLATK